MGRPKKVTGHILGLISALQPGDHFYTEEQSYQIQSYAARAGVKVKSEVCLITEGHKGDTPIITKANKVTIL